jgi:hypothetical protein
MWAAGGPGGPEGRAGRNGPLRSGTPANRRPQLSGGATGASAMVAAGRGDGTVPRLPPLLRALGQLAGAQAPGAPSPSPPMQGGRPNVRRAAAQHAGPAAVGREVRGGAAAAAQGGRLALVGVRLARGLMRLLGLLLRCIPCGPALNRRERACHRRRRGPPMSSCAARGTLLGGAPLPSSPPPQRWRGRR